MKGTEKIIAHIQADAKAQADAILAQAEQQCAQLREAYDKQASSVYGEKIRAGVKACQDQADSVQRIARMEAKKEILALKQDMVSRSFDRAKEQLLALPAEQYGALLAKLAAQASVTGDEEIILNAADRAALGEKVVQAANTLLSAAGKNAALTLSGQTGDFEGGLILRRGSIEANCTLELLVDLQRQELSAQLAGVLFG